ncbi:lef-6 [Spodoptera frugiperda granulovirus]|uniref:Lef-6 n=1 Tax=Spodoptera frugiperda granulovirus TaxID=307454 RepID=A0A0C5AS45_9BBAC|nr:lef-6 [Spodoptera frugiperda granulovirus]AJK91734.1 lef-6 [Spodoptera frugiperda granulovirus]AXS01096.1 lef-6 [Spodoptera frugiperda granulovirus]
MSSKKLVKLHNLSYKLYPLWLTKDLVLYMGGVKLCDKVDWHKSTRRCLYVKSMADAEKIIDLNITYPDGYMAIFKTDETVQHIMDEEERFQQQLTWDDD